MFGSYSYLVSIFMFAGAAVLVEWVFGFHLFKKHLRPILIAVAYSLVITPVGEAVALRWGNWVYSAEHTFDVFIFGAAVETYVFVVFVGVAVASIVVVWTFYEDQKKPLILQSLKDVFRGTYAVWKRSGKV